MPRPVYRLASETTSRRLASSRWFLARRPSSAIHSRSPPDVQVQHRPAPSASFSSANRPGLDPLGQLDLLLGVEQRDLADLLEVVLDRVGRGAGRGDLRGGQVLVVVAVDERLVLGLLAGLGPGRGDHPAGHGRAGAGRPHCPGMAPPQWRRPARRHRPRPPRRPCRWRRPRRTSSSSSARSPSTSTSSSASSTAAASKSTSPIEVVGVGVVRGVVEARLVRAPRSASLAGRALRRVRAWPASRPPLRRLGGPSLACGPARVRARVRLRVGEGYRGSPRGRRSAQPHRAHGACLPRGRPFGLSASAASAPRSLQRLPPQSPLPSLADGGQPLRRSTLADRASRRHRTLSCDTYGKKLDPTARACC